MLLLGGVAGILPISHHRRGAGGAAGGAALMAAALYIGSRIDAHRRSAAVLYAFEVGAAGAYEAVTKAFVTASSI